MEITKTIKPGKFSVAAVTVAADNRRDEFDTKNEVIVNNNVPVDYVFIGDSITELWELNAYFGNNGKIIINRGIGGDSSEYVLKRFEADVIQLKPKCAIMKIGINDTWEIEGTFNGGILRSSEYVCEEVTQNIEAIIKLAKANDQKLILCSILPTGPVCWAPKMQQRNNLVFEMNRKIRVLAAENGLEYVDYHSKLVGEDGITLIDGLSYDGVHPHVLGYNIMSNVLVESLKNGDLVFAIK